MNKFANFYARLDSLSIVRKEDQRRQVLIMAQPGFEQQC